jgi:hypothetical protein
LELLEEFLLTDEEFLSLDDDFALMLLDDDFILLLLDKDFALMLLEDDLPSSSIDSSAGSVFTLEPPLSPQATSIITKHQRANHFVQAIASSSFYGKCIFFNIYYFMRKINFPIPAKTKKSRRFLRGKILWILSRCFRNTPE